MANFLEESKSSEYGLNPETDSPEVENEEDYVDDSDDSDNSDWDDEGFEDEGQPESIERPTAPNTADYQDQEAYDEDFEIYLGKQTDYEAQQPLRQEKADLDAETYNTLDLLGMTGSARPELRKAIAQADEQLVKAANAEMRGDTGKAKEHRQRAEWMSRTAQEEMKKDSLAQKKGKEIALHTAEAVIRNARSMDSNEYKERFPQGRGYDHDVRQAIDAFNSATDGDFVYVSREYSVFNPDLAEAPRGLNSGEQLMQLKIPNHFETGKELAAAARSSSMSIFDYLVSTGGISIKPREPVEEEEPESEYYRGMSNAEYRKQPRFKIRGQVIGGAPAPKRF